MKRTVILLSVIFLLIFSAGTSFPFQNEPDGFLGLKWGSSLDDLKKHYKKVKLIRGGKIKSYEPDGGYTKFSGVMTYLTYQFYEEKMYFVNIFFEKREDGEKLAEALKVSYGDPTESYDDGALWVGKKTGIAIDFEKKFLSFYDKDVMEGIDIEKIE